MDLKRISNKINIIPFATYMQANIRKSKLRRGWCECMKEREYEVKMHDECGCLGW